MPIGKKPTSWQEEVVRGFSRFFSRSSSQERNEEPEKTSGNEQEQADSSLSSASPQDKDKKLPSENSSLEESAEPHQSPSRFFSTAPAQDKDKKLPSEKSSLEESAEAHQSPSRFFSRTSTQDKDKKLPSEKSSLEESTEAHQSPSRFFSRASTQDKDKKLPSEKSSLEENTEAHQSPSRFFSRASTQDKDKKLPSENSSLEESAEPHQSPSRFFSRASTQDKDKKLPSEKSSLEESTEAHQSPSRFFSRASTQDKDKKLPSEKSSLEESAEVRQSPSRFFFRGTTPDKEAKDKSFTPEEQEKGLNLSKLFNRRTSQDNNNVSSAEEQDTFSSITRQLSVTFSQGDERDIVRSKATKVSDIRHEDKSPITVRDNNEHLPETEADQNISKTQKESRTDWNHDAKSPIQEKQPKEKMREFFGQLFGFTSKSPVASPKQTPSNQEQCQESQDEPDKKNLEEEFVTVEQSFQEPDLTVQDAKVEPVNREIDLETSDNKKKEENSSQVLEPGPSTSSIKNTSKLEAPSITYGTYRGSKKIRKLLRRRADVNSPIPENEEVTDTETTPTILDYNTDNEITPYPRSDPDAELCVGNDEETSTQNSNTLPPYLENFTKFEEPLQPVDLQEDPLGNSETVTVLQHSAGEESMISNGLQTDEDRNAIIPDSIQRSLDSQPDVVTINGNKQIVELNETSEDESLTQSRSTMNNLQENIEDNTDYAVAPQKETNPQAEIVADADEKPKTITELQHDADDIANITNAVQPDEINYSEKSGVSLSLTDNNSNIIDKLETVNLPKITKPLHEVTSITSIYKTELQSDKEENSNTLIEPKVDVEKDSDVAAGLQTSPVNIKAQQFDTDETSILAVDQQPSATDNLDMSLGLQQKTENLTLTMENQQPCADETFNTEETSFFAQNTQAKINDSKLKTDKSSAGLDILLLEHVHPSSNSKVNTNSLVDNDADVSTKNNEIEFSLYTEAKLTREKLSTHQIPGHLESNNDSNSIYSDGDLQPNGSIISQLVQSKILDSQSTDESYQTSIPQSNKYSVCVQESLGSVNPSGKPDINDIPNAEEILIAADNNNISDDLKKHHINVSPKTATSFNFRDVLHDDKCKTDLITDLHTDTNSLNNICSLSSSSLNEGNIREALDVDSFDEGHSPTFAIPSSSSSFASACVDEQFKSSLPSSDSVDSGLISPACTPEEIILYNNNNKPDALALDDQENITIVESDKAVPNMFNLRTVKVTNTSQVDYIPTTEEVRDINITNAIQGTNVVIVNDITPKLGNNTTTEKTVPTLKERIGKLSSNQKSQADSKDVYIAKVSVKSIDVKEVKIAPYSLQSEIITISKLPTPTFEPEYIQLSIPPPPPIDSNSDLQGFQQDLEHEKVTTTEKSSFKHFKPKENNTSKVQPDPEAVKNTMPLLTHTSPDVTIENIKNNNFTALMRSNDEDFINMSSLTGTHDNEIDKILSTCDSELETKDVNLQDTQKEPKETNIYCDFSLQAKENASHEIHGKPPASPIHSTIPKVENDTIQMATEHSELNDTLIKQKANELICTVLNKAVEEIAPNNSTLNTISTSENENELFSPVSEANNISDFNDTNSTITSAQINDLLNEYKLENQNQIHTEKTEVSHMPSTNAELGPCGNDQVDLITTDSVISLSNENSEIETINLNSAKVEENAVLGSPNGSLAIISNKVPSDPCLEPEIPIMQDSSDGMQKEQSHEAETTGELFISNNSKHENNESTIKESGLHTEELKQSDDRTNVDEINHSTNELLTQTSDEALKVDQAKEDTHELSATSKNDRSNPDEINHLTNELLTQTSEAVLKVDQAKEDTNELPATSENDKSSVNEMNHSINELLTQISDEVRKVDLSKEETNELLSTSQNDRASVDEINHSTMSANQLLTQKSDEALKVDQTKENTKEIQNCEQGDIFVVSDIIGVKHISCDHIQNATDSGLGGVRQENDESQQVTERIYPKNDNPLVSMANKIVSDIITSAKQNVTSSILQASLNKNTDREIQSEITNNAHVSSTGADSITTQNTQISNAIKSLFEVGKDYNISSELTNTDGEQNQYISHESKNTLEGTVNGHDILTEVQIPRHSPHLGWSLGTDEDSNSFEGMNNTDILKNTDGSQNLMVNYLGDSGEIVGEAVNMVATNTDLLSHFQFSIHKANVIEISENDDDQDNNECYMYNSEETSDQDSYLVVQARRRSFYPISLSPIYEDDSSSEDILSTSASPKLSETDNSNCSSILTLLQSVSDRLKQTNTLDNKEVSHEECISLPDMSANHLHGYSNMDAAEKTEDMSKTQVVDQPTPLQPQIPTPIPTRSSLFITKTMPEIKSLAGTGRQSILMHLTKKPIVLNSKLSGEALSPTAVEESSSLQKMEDFSGINSNCRTEYAAVPSPVEESSKLILKSEVETNSHLEPRSVHFQSNLNSSPETVSCQENVDSSKQIDSSVLINSKCSVEASLPPILEDSSSSQKEAKTGDASCPPPSALQTVSKSVLPIQTSEVEPKPQHTMINKCPSPPETRGGDFQKLGSSQQDHSLKTQAHLMSPVQSETIKYNPRPGKVVISDIFDHENKIEVNADVIDASSWIFPNGVNIRVIRGCWILYEKPSFEGLAHVLEEGEAELSYLWEAPQSTSVPNTITIGSIRRVVKDYIPEIILSPQYTITGSSIHLQTEVPSIESLTYHMHYSLVVKSGVWLAYTQPQFSGSVTVLEEGSEILKIQEYGISSVRPLKMGGLKVQMPSDPKIILYEKPCFEGRSREFSEHIYSLKSLLSDGDEQEIGSVRVLGGIWVGYDMERFKGRQYLLEEGEYPDCQSWGGTSSSLLSMSYLQADFMEASVTLYESDREDLKQLEVFNLEVPDVEQAGYGPETQSIHVKKGMWVAYEQKHFCGEQYILEKGRYKSCADWGGNNNTIMSIRPVLLEPHGSNEPKHLIRAYSGANFQGECVDLTKDVSDFKSFTPSSFKVLRGCWVLCYQGETSNNLCVLEEGHFPDMASCGCPAAVIKFIQPIDYVFAEPSLSLFALDSCEGRELHFEEAVNSVLSRDLHFYTQSVWIRSGLWIAYEDANFLGRQILLEAKKILNWAEFSGWKAIGSLRPLKQPGVYLRIKNQHNNKYLTVTGNLADTRAMSVCVSPRNGQCTQIWYFCRGLLKSKASDACLDVIGGKNNPGSKVSLWTEHGKPRQKWRIHKDGTITSYISDELVLDLKGGNYYDQNHIVVNNLQPGLPTQKWDIEIL